MFAKKSLGQNFLNSKTALQAIIEAGDLADSDIVLEIGPGHGALTEKLLATGAQVVAVEKDDQLFESLQKKFTKEIKNKKLILIHDDILNIDFSQPAYHILHTTYKLIANIPYNLTGQIIRQFLSEGKKQPSRIVLMLQKEVAKRIVASDKKESLLSISVKIFGQPKYVKTVPAGAFVPAPKVDSAILLIENIKRDLLKKNKITEKKFFDLLHRGFAQKRKLLTGNLKIVPTILTACKINERARAENLTVENWLCLATKV